MFGTLRQRHVIGFKRPCSAPAIRAFSRISPGCGSKTAILPGRLPRFRRRTGPTKAPFCSIISGMPFLAGGQSRGCGLLPRGRRSECCRPAPRAVRGGPSPPCLCVLVQGEERAAALRRYAPERNDMELWDYVLLCVQCEAYAMAAPVLPELVSQWALTDQTLAMTALCLRHVPEERERVLHCFSDELEGGDRLLHLLGDANECARLCGKASHFFRRPQTTRGISRKNAFEKPAVREKKMQRHSLRSRRRLCRLRLSKNQPSQKLQGKETCERLTIKKSSPKCGGAAKI